MSRESRVLVFVHDATDGEMVEMQMRKAHVRCTVQRVTQKDQFLKAMRSTPPDLAIVDGAFPRVDVAGIMQSALQVSPGIPWVVLSTSQAEDALVRWMKAGAADVVTRKNYTRLGTVASELLGKRPAGQNPGAAHPAPGSPPGQHVPRPGPAQGIAPSQSGQPPRTATGASVPPAQPLRPAPGASVPPAQPLRPAPGASAPPVQPFRPATGSPAVAPGLASVPPGTPFPPGQPFRPAPVAPASASGPGQGAPPPRVPPSPMQSPRPAPFGPASAPGPARAGQAQPSGQAAPPAGSSGSASPVPLDAFGEPMTREGFPPIPSVWDARPGAQPAAAAAPPAPHVQAAPARPPAQTSAREHQLFQEIVEHAGDLVAVLDEQGKRLYSNPPHAEVLDSPERLQGTIAYVDIHPDDRQMVGDAFRTAFREGKESRVEYRLMDKKGSVRVMESVAVVLPSSSAGEARAVVVSRDVTDRVHQEQDREALLRALGPLTGERYFHNLVYVLAETLKVRYVLVSESLYQPYERVRSIAYWANGMLMPPFEYDLADTTCEAVYSTRGPVHYPDSVQELFPKETALVEMEARSYLGVPLIGSDSTIVGHLFIMDDKRMADPSRAQRMLTEVSGRTAMEMERLRHEEVVRGAESRLRFILESLADGVLVTDSLDIITYVSEQVGTDIGCGSVDLIGKPLTQFVERPDDAGGTALPADGEARVRLRCCDGTLRSAVLQAKPLMDGAGKAMGTVFLVRRVTD